MVQPERCTVKKPKSKRSRVVLESRGETEGLYQLELVRCGNERCKRCKRRATHGPYWYLYQWQPGRRVNTGRLRSIYVGKELQRRIA